MLARFPKASRHRGVEAAYWLPQAWSTVNNMPAVSADKPSLMRLQQKHSNMHYRTSAGIFSGACLGKKKKKKEILDSVCMHTPFIFHSFFFKLYSLNSNKSALDRLVFIPLLPTAKLCSVMSA